MNQRTFIIVLAVVSMFPALASAQSSSSKGPDIKVAKEGESPQASRVGLGFSLVAGSHRSSLRTDNDFQELGQALSHELSVPMRFGAFRIEPSFGFLRVAATRELDDVTEEVGASLTQVSLGVSYVLDVSESAQFYVGPRLGLVHIETSSVEAVDGGLDTFSFERERTDLRVGLSVGGEQFLTKNLSLGLESRLSTVFEGDTTFKPEGDRRARDSSLSLTSLEGLLTVRLYFR